MDFAAFFIIAVVVVILVSVGFLSKDPTNPYKNNPKQPKQPKHVKPITIWTIAGGVFLGNLCICLLGALIWMLFLI